MNSWCTVSLYSHSFSSIWRMQKNWSVVDLLCLNSHWWSPIISSMYGLDLERWIWANIFYEVDSSNIPITTVNFITLLVNWYTNGLLPLIRQFFLILNRISLWISEHNISPPAWNSSAKILSLPGEMWSDTFIAHVCSQTFSVMHVNVSKMTIQCSFPKYSRLTFSTLQKYFRPLGKLGGKINLEMSRCPPPPS
jgi:hypothetical protein